MDVGQRANYVIVDPSADGGYELYYSHWAANRVPLDLFWGPAQALAFIRGQRSVPSKRWLESVWAEGGALIDPERQTLLLFGGDDMDCEPGLRRVYLQLAAPMWPGWSVRWADGELAELADYVGVAEETVLPTPPVPDDPKLVLSDPGQGWYDTALTVRWEDGSVDAWGAAEPVCDVLMLGSDLVEQARERRAGPDRIPASPKSSPRGGVHVDVAAGSVHAWALSDGATAQRLLADRWGPWQKEWLGDRWEQQVELADGCFSFPVRGDAEFLDLLVTRLSNHRHISGVEALKRSLAADGDVGGVNPWALLDDQVPADEAMRDTLLAGAVAAYGT